MGDFLASSFIGRALNRVSVVLILLAACNPGEISEGAGRIADPGGGGSVPGQPDPGLDLCPEASLDVSVSGGWRSVPSSLAALGDLAFETMVRPGADAQDAMVGIGAEPIDDFSSAAIAVRFAPDGYFDVRDGASYASDQRIPYERGRWYSVAVWVDVQSKTYGVDVGPCGEERRVLIRGAAFRSDAAVSDRLTHWGIWSSQSASLDASTPTWTTSGSCAPSSCAALSAACGTPSDGCGGSLSCGGCDTGLVCSAGECVDAPSPPAPPPPPPPPGDDTCVLGQAISGVCTCGGSTYTTGYCCDGGYSFSACESSARYVTPGGSGSRDGSDWANAINGLPSSLARGTVYWLAAGSYGTQTFDDPPSGQAGITLRKATAASHGTDAGWDPGYGSGQAVFGPIRFSTDRYTLDGGEPNGIETVGQMGTEAVAEFAAGRVVLRNVEINGGVQKSGSTQTAGACMGGDVSASYVVFDRCEIHNIADDGLGIYADHVKVLNSRIHDLHGCGTDSSCSGPCYNGHSDGLEMSHASHIELVGNMVYDVRSTAAIFMEDWGSGGVSDLVAYNNVFYTPTTALTIYLQDLDGAKFHNNIIWGRMQGDRYGGLSMGNDVTNLEMHNNIILNINYNHMNASHDPNHHDLDYNLYGMINAGEYTANDNDLVGDPRFADVPISANAGDHKGSELTLEDFRPGFGSPAIDSGRAIGVLPAIDMLGRDRPAGGGWDRGPLEVQ